jgi:hypothetical protein
MTNYVHIILDDGSVVQRGSQNRDYRFAVIGQAYNKRAAVKELSARVSNAEYSITQHEKTLASLRYGQLDKSEIQHEGAVYERKVFTWGTDLHLVTMSCPSDTPEGEKVTYEIDRLEGLIMFYEGQRAEAQIALEYVESRDDDWKAINAHPNKLIAGLGPICFGFSQHMDTADERAAREDRYYPMPVYVRHTVYGKAPLASVKGRTK